MEESLSGLRPDQLAGLLEVAADRPVPRLAGEGEAVADLLRATLTREIVLDSSGTDSLPVVLGRSCEELAAYRSLAELLLDPAANEVALRTLKDYAKELASESGSGTAKAVAVTLYYAAIAAALVHQNTKITQHSRDRLESYFAELTGKPWIPADLKSLFAKARDLCQ